MLEVRRLQQEDVVHLYAISLKAHQRGYETLIPDSGVALFTKHYTYTEKHRTKFTNEIAERFNDKNWAIWVALVDTHIVGYAEIEKITPTLYYERSLFVDPLYQSMGAGQLLFEHSLGGIDDARVVLAVIKNNERAIRLYEKNGFKVTDQKTPYFYDAEQVTMIRDGKVKSNR